MLIVLVPVKQIGQSPNIRHTVAALIGSIPGIVNVLLLQLFCFTVLAVIGVAIFSGNQYAQCRLTAEPDKSLGENSWPPVPDTYRLCQNDASCREQFAEETDYTCGETWDYKLDPFEYDGVNDNETILFGIPGFDDTIQGLFTIFHIVSMESWTTMMYNF